MKYLVVARYKADITWLDKFSDWVPIVVQKQTEELDGDMPNVGREPAAFCHAIITRYSAIQPTDRWVFVQDHPFDHCLDLEVKLAKNYPYFTWLGGERLKRTDGTGKPDHPDLQIKEYYEKWTGQPWQMQQEATFAPGGQFVVTGEELLSYPKSFYKTLYDDVCINENAWVAERLWGKIFNAHESLVLVE
jgi:hypothetical protein